MTDERSPDAAAGNGPDRDSRDTDDGEKSASDAAPQVASDADAPTDASDAPAATNEGTAPDEAAGTEGGAATDEGDAKVAPPGGATDIIRSAEGAAGRSPDSRAGRRHSRREDPEASSDETRDERDAAEEGGRPGAPKAVQEIDPSSCTEMSPDDALQTLLAGEPLKGVMVVGLDARGQEFPKAVEITDSILVKPVFQQAVFREELNVVRTTFLGATQFGDTYDGLRQSRSWNPDLGAVFHHPVNFSRCLFKGPFFAAGIVAHSTVNFRPCTFVGVAAFPAANLQQKAWFTNCWFQKSFSAFEAGFGGELLDFGTATLDKDANFARATFDCRVSFWNSTLNGNVDFDRAHFNSETNFFHTRTTSELDLKKSVHRRPLDLRKAFIDGAINLHLCEAPRILIHRGQVDGHLASERKKLDFAVRNDYGQLVTIFEANKDYRSMDWAYHQFRRASNRVSKQPFFVKWLEWVVLDLGSGYGTKPFNIGILMAICIVFFSVLFAMFSADFVYNVEPDLIRNVPADGEVELSLPNAIYFSVATFTTMGFGDWSPRHDSPMRFVVILEGFIGLFLMALFVAMLTRKIIR